jgi:hypothetical protein
MGQNEGREGREKMETKNRKIEIRKYKIGTRKSKKMGPKINKMGWDEPGRVGRGGENGKKKNNK